MFQHVIIFLVAYLVGSIPTAYLAVKRRSGVDIRKVESGNVGAFNAFQATRSKLLGVLVGVADGLKGLLTAGVVLIVLGWNFWEGAIALLGAVVGHNYPVWLRFRGGRGLATAAGGLFVVGPAYTVVWCTLWPLLKVWKKDILTANIIASLVTPAILSLLPSTWLVVAMTSEASADEYRLFAWVLSVLLLIGHADVLATMVVERGRGARKQEKSTRTSSE